MIARTEGNPFFLEESVRTLVETGLLVGAPGAYRLAQSLELGMRPLQAHCHRALGTLYAKTGRQEQARAELSTAIEMYGAMDMTFWLPQAEAVLAQVEG